MYFEGLKFRIEYREEKEKKREPLVFKPKFRDCPKEYLGRDVYLVILENGTKKKSKEVRMGFGKSHPKNKRAR